MNAMQMDSETSAKETENAGKYPMDFRRRGLAIIINNANDHEALAHLKNVLSRDMKFDTKGSVLENISGGKMIDGIHEKCQMYQDKWGFEIASCVALVILGSSDSDGRILGDDGVPVPLEWLLRPFKDFDRFPGLKGKPKLVFTQLYSKDTEQKDGLQENTDGDSDELDNVAGKTDLSKEADFIHISSKLPDQSAYSIQQGLAAIKILCDKLRDHSDTFEISKIVSVVKQEIIKSKVGLEAFEATSLLRKQLVFECDNEVDCDDLPLVRYGMENKYRGLAIIINNEKFDKNPNQKVEPRTGTNKDEIKLKNLFTHLGFQDDHIYVDGFRNLTGDGMKEGVAAACSAYDKGIGFDNCDCVILAVLSHGNQVGVYGADLQCVPLSDIYQPFLKYPGLKGKPKIIITQACRGSKLEQVKADRPDALPVDADNQETDIIKLYPTAPDYFALRSMRSGSSFITHLCLELQKHAFNKDMVEILTRVNKEVASDRRDVHQVGKCLVCSCFTSSLTKELQFLPQKKQELHVNRSEFERMCSINPGRNIDTMSDVWAAALRAVSDAIVDTIQNGCPVEIPGVTQELYWLPPAVPRKHWTKLDKLLLSRENAIPNTVDGFKWFSLRLVASRYDKLVKLFGENTTKAHEMMPTICQALMTKFHAKMGYTQSNEIIIIVEPSNTRNQHAHEYNGHVTKLCSFAASIAANHVTAAIVRQQTEQTSRDLPDIQFDCRVGSYNSWEEARSIILLGAYNCQRNGITDAVKQAKPDTKKTAEQSNTEKLKWLQERNLLEALPAHQKHGSFFVRVNRKRECTDKRTKDTKTCLRSVTEYKDENVLLLIRENRLLPEDDVVPHEDGREINSKCKC